MSYPPEVLFLDEPTLGLDVSMQGRLRGFIAEYNRRTGATVILTSHYMADVMALCPRVIFIHQGALLYDGELTALAQQLAPFKLIRVVFSQIPGEGCLADLPADATVLEQNDKGLTLRAVACLTGLPVGARAFIFFTNRAFLGTQGRQPGAACCAG